MKVKKILVGVLACAMVCSSVPYANYTVPENSAITASAADYTEGITNNGIKYKNYGEYVEITGCDTSATEVKIPDKIEGLPVTSIRFYAFSGFKGLTSITIPDSVTAIGAFAFWNCNSLKSITIPENVKSIGECAFENTEWYNNQPDGLVYVRKVAYKYKGEMPENTEIVLKNDTVCIANQAFASCTGLTSIKIPDSVTSIGASAFCNCSNLTSITIPDSVTLIGELDFGCTDVDLLESYTFYNCTGLESITIENPKCEIYDDSHTISDTATIYGYSNSTAQTYAEKYNRKFVSLDNVPTTGTSTVTGDATGDGKLDVSDVIAISAYVANPENNPLPEQALLNCDVHNTGNGLDANDVLMIQQYLAKIITEL